MRKRCSRYSFILDISSLDVLTLNRSSTQVLLVFEPKYSSKENQNAPIPSEIAYATLWDSGVDYLPPARWPVGSPRPERLPMPRGRYSIRSVSNDGAR